MKYYVELTVLPDAETSAYYLWERIYTQIHLALVENKEADNTLKVGISFPEYNLDAHQLGNKLRLFSESAEKLEQLDLARWLSRLSDYVHFTKVREVPSKVDGHGYFKRLIEKGSHERLARRRAKKLSISYDEALAYFQSDKDRKRSAKEVYRYPFITLKSLSSGEKYPLTIALVVTDEANTGKGFSTYGLSSKSTVPLF